MLDMLYILGPILPTIVTWLYVLLIVSVIQSYLITSLANTRLLRLLNHPKPNIAFIPFSNAYIMGYLAFDKRQNILYTDESLHSARKKAGIRSFIFLTIIPIILLVTFIWIIADDMYALLQLLVSSTELHITLPPSPTLPLGVAGILFVSLWIITYSLTLQYKGYKKFVPSNYEAILWVLVPFVILVSPLSSYSFVWPILVQFTPLIFAYNRAKTIE